MTNSGFGTADAPMVDGTVWITGADAADGSGTLRSLDGGVGDPNGKSDVQRHFEQASPNFEVLKGTGTVIGGTTTTASASMPIPPAIPAQSATEYESFGHTVLAFIDDDARLTKLSARGVRG